MNCSPPYDDYEQRVLDSAESIIAVSGIDPLSIIHNYRVTKETTSMKPQMDPSLVIPKQNPLDVQVGGGHYKDRKIQPIEYCHVNKLNAEETAIVKYITRWREKGGYQDLQKIKHYVDLLIELTNRYDGGDPTQRDREKTPQHIAQRNPNN